jgi:dTDP-glucose pyrophosphorylase
MAETDPLDWRATLIAPAATLHDVIAALDRTAMQILMVVDDTRCLLGTVTDGDVRRALLRGAPMETEAQAVMFPTPLVVGPDIGRDVVLTLMRMNKIHQLPVVDGERRVVGLHAWDEIIAAPDHDNLVVLMAGGFGKRMMPYTEHMPKPMLEVAGKPLLEHALERAHGEGFRRFVISLHYRPEVIRDHFGDGSRFGVEIAYVEETEPLGTAGALSLISERPEAPMVIANGDVLTGVRFAEMLEFHRNFGGAATMAVRDHVYQNPFGVVQTEGMQITGFEEKPVWRTKINAGLYVLEPEALDLLKPRAFCNMPTLFERLQARGQKTIAYPMHESWMDVGNPQDLMLARRLLEP